MMLNEMIDTLQQSIFHLRIQNYKEGNGFFRKVLEQIGTSEIFAAQLTDEESMLRGLLQSMMDALEADDMILLADLIEEGFIPFLQSAIEPVEAQQTGHYTLEPTSAGFWTVKNNLSGLYLHSNGNPMEESRIWVDRIYQAQYEKYAVWGCGLGYHILQLYELAQGAISITVFDEQEEIFQLANRVGVMENIPHERIRFVADETGEQFAHFLSDDSVGILIHYPSVKSIQSEGLRNSLRHFFPAWNTVRQYERELAINFRSNTQKQYDNVDDLREAFFKRRVVLVAGGPSVDDCVDFLREAGKDKVIVAVTAIFKRLIQLGVQPDYLVAMDPYQRSMVQIAGVERYKIPLIVDSTAYWEVGEAYAGKKYLAYQREYALSEEAAAREGRTLYETGGSVTTLALDILLQSGVSEIYLVGVDLAYPGGVTHAMGTDARTRQDTTGMEMVESVTGELVPADASFVAWRHWIERKLAAYSQVKVYNLSTCGARIQGTKHIP